MFRLVSSAAAACVLLGVAVAGVSFGGEGAKPAVIPMRSLEAAEVKRQGHFYHPQERRNLKKLIASELRRAKRAAEKKGH